MTDSFRTDYAAELAERHSHGQPDQPRKRTAASFDTLAERIRQVAAARKAHDSFACRRELRELAKEAALLAAMDPLKL